MNKTLSDVTDEKLYKKLPFYRGFLINYLLFRPHIALKYIVQMFLKVFYRGDGRGEKKQFVHVSGMSALEHNELL